MKTNLTSSTRLDSQPSEAFGKRLGFSSHHGIVSPSKSRRRRDRRSDVDFDRADSTLRHRQAIERARLIIEARELESQLS